MGIEALKQENLERIAEIARRKYVRKENELPGMGCCGEAMECMARELYPQLTCKLFLRYVHPAFFRVEDGRGHFLLVVGGEKPRFNDTFNMGIKLDPTIYQFRDLHPRLDALNGKSVFNGDYPKIYREDSLKRESFDFFKNLVEKMRIEQLAWGYVES